MTDLTPAPETAAPAFGTWQRWSEGKPVNPKLTYRWRVPERLILGLRMRPEWSEKMHFCGMGHAANEWWPPFSHWNGYIRSIPDGTEWREAKDGEDEILWEGLDLLPCPFTGKPPRVEFKGRWIGAPCYQAESLSIHAWMVSSYGWTDAVRLQKTWNTRPALPPAPEMK